MRPDKVGTKNPVAAILDQRLVAVHGFADAPRGIPILHSGAIHNAGSVFPADYLGCSLYVISNFSGQRN
jgi:hypothetical protein